MFLDLKSIFVNENSSLPINYELNMSEVELSGGFPLQKPVSISGRVFNRAGIVTLKLLLEVEYSAPCDRCGEDAVNTYCFDMDRVVVNHLDGDDLDEYIVAQDMQLDLDELCRCEVLLEIPTKHLCSNDCKGVCNKCGKNLNLGKCSCPKKELDSRFAALDQLLNND